ncbi:MAG: hypothetical protein ACLFUR_01785 [Candidatus Hadarchaeia archaeon]
MDDLEVDAEVKVTGIFVIFAIAVGVFSALAGLTGRQGGLVGLFLFYIAYKVSSIKVNFAESDYEGDAKSLIKTGIIPYWFLLLVSWTFVHTLMLY